MSAARRPSADPKPDPKSDTVHQRPTGAERVLLFADSLAQRVEAEAEHRWESWLAVRLDGERLALPVRQVQEVVRPGTITRVPHAPFPVCGVTNLRGTVLAVVDLRLRLGLSSRPVDAASRIVVVLSRGRRIGLLVEAAEQVVAIDALAIEPAPDDVLTDRSYYLVGVYRRPEDLLILLDVDRVLEVRAVDQSAADQAEEDS